MQGPLQSWLLAAEVSLLIVHVSREWKQFTYVICLMLTLFLISLCVCGNEEELFGEENEWAPQGLLVLGADTQNDAETLGHLCTWMT